MRVNLRDPEHSLSPRMWLFCAMVTYSILVGMTSGVELPSHLDPWSQVTAALNRYRDAVKNPVYSNDWAVEVHGGQEVADEIASAQGFINIGKVTLTAPST